MKQQDQKVNYPILPNIGKYSKIKKPKICNWPDIIAIPVRSKITPENLKMYGKYLFIFLEKNKNFSIKAADIINGIAKPREQKESKKIL